MTKKQGSKSAPIMETYTNLRGNTVTVGIATVQLATRAAGESFTTIIQASHDNAGRVSVGNIAVQAFELDGGESLSLPVSPTDIYIRASQAGQVVNWLAGG